MSAQRAPASRGSAGPRSSAMLIASYSADPLARASAAFDRQFPATAERRPERRAISTVKTMTSRAPSTIHSHTSELADVPDAGDVAGAAECALGEAGTVTVDVVGGAVTVVGGCVGGEIVGTETVTLWLDAAFLMWLIALPHPAVRHTAARMAPARTSL